MVRGRAGRGDRIIDALDLEPGRQRRRSGRGHRLGHGERADASWAPLVRVMSAASTMVRVEGPPEPMIRPVRSLEISFASRPAVADRLLHRDMVPGRAAAQKAHRAAVDHLLGLQASARHAPGSESRARRIFRRAMTPDRPSRRLASTSCVLLPIEETIPMPVTTTRLIAILLNARRAERSKSAVGRSELRLPPAWRRRTGRRACP